MTRLQAALGCGGICGARWPGLTGLIGHAKELEFVSEKYDQEQGDFIMHHAGVLK